MLCILWNEQCFAAERVMDMKLDAEENVFTYHEHFSSCWFFYIMVLSLNMFIHSCAYGRLCDLAMRHLNMETLKDQIKQKELTYRK